MTPHGLKNFNLYKTFELFSFDLVVIAEKIPTNIRNSYFYLKFYPFVRHYKIDT